MCVCVWIKTGLGSAGLVPTDCLKWRNRFKAGSGCWQVELCAAHFLCVRSCLHVIKSALTCSNQGEWFVLIHGSDSPSVPTTSDFVTSLNVFSLFFPCRFFFPASDYIRDVFLCVSKFSRLKSSVCNGINRDTCLTPIPGQLSVFNVICWLPVLVGFVPYC